jgi:hypothetical protein
MPYLSNEELKVTLDYLVILYALIFQCAPSDAPKIQQLIRQLIAKL